MMTRINYQELFARLLAQRLMRLLKDNLLGI